MALFQNERGEKKSISDRIFVLYIIKYRIYIYLYIIKQLFPTIIKINKPNRRILNTNNK